MTYLRQFYVTEIESVKSRKTNVLAKPTRWFFGEANRD